MARAAAKIAKVQLASTRRRGWPVFKVREITEGGRVLNSWEFDRPSEASAYARRIARQHGAELITA